jgi:uncharacterized membrane protein
VCIQYFHKAPINLALSCLRIVSQGGKVLKIFIFVVVVEYTLSIVTICVLWSDRSFIVEGIEDIFSALLSTNILSMTVIAILPTLMAKCTAN